MPGQELDYSKVKVLVKMALVEDIGTGDVTTEATVPADMIGSMQLVTREDMIVAGLPLVERVFAELSRQVKCELHIGDGERVKAGTALATMRGPMRALLTGERVTLNFLQQLCGIATLTRQFVDVVAGTGAKIFDTRKTTPGWRYLEKYAVRMGGGQNHRMGLYDMALIKDNHVACLRSRGVEGSLVEAVTRARSRGVKVELEVETPTDLEEALKAGADILLLDNFTVEQLAEAVKTVRRRKATVALEASGGVTLDTARRIAQTGVDRISVGMLTHTVRSIDIAAEVRTD